MEYRIIKPEKYITGKWSGGTTTQLVIYPEDASYSERNFIFRLSSATVDIEQSDFTHLPDYDRWLMILSGNARLVHDNKREIVLSPYEYDSFGGEESTVSYGKVTDYNLMLKKGYPGSMEAVKLGSDMVEINILHQEGYKKGFAGVFLKDAHVKINICDEELNLEGGCQLLVIYNDTDTVNLGISGEGTAVITQGKF